MIEKTLPRTSQIIEQIRKAGLEITTVNIKKPSMDDVFVHYTGHGLREGEPQEKPEGIEVLGASE